MNAAAAVGAGSSSTLRKNTRTARDMATSSGVSIHTEKSMKAPVALCTRPKTGFEQDGRTRSAAGYGQRQILERRNQIIQRHFVRIAAAPQPILHLLLVHARVKTIVGEGFCARKIVQEQTQQGRFAGARNTGQGYHRPAFSHCGTARSLGRLRRQGGLGGKYEVSCPPSLRITL
jgi:hypothetical protein